MKIRSGAAVLAMLLASAGRRSAHDYLTEADGSNVISIWLFWI